jgi:TetR/AcrR family transcriptional regulator
VKNPPTDLAQRLLDVSDQVLRTDPALRLEDVARLVGASRASLYYYFSGRDDLLSFLLTTHTRQGAEAIQAALDPSDPPPRRLRAMVMAMVDYLGRHPGTCAGLLGALGSAGQMSEVMNANDARIASPLRELLTEGKSAGDFAIDSVADAANAILGAVLLPVLGRSMSGSDPADATFQHRLTDQIVQGVLAH